MDTTHPDRLLTEDYEAPTRPFLVVDPAARDRGVLVQTAGLQAGRPYRIPREGALVGRSAECDISLDDDTLSRHHARIARVGRDYVLEDLGATNGCFVGDRRVQSAALRDGDRVGLGSRLSFRFHIVTEEEERALVRLYDAGLRDSLTGLANRKQLEETLEGELSFAHRHGTDLCVIMIDVDRFKLVNDTHGHLAGDAVLRAIARILACTVRTEDIVARFGGEEFVVVARGAPLPGGQKLAERLRSELERAPIRLEHLVLRVTASFGVASLTCARQPGVSGMLACADQRLYRAKALGRNRVITSD
jgi:two-component system cell cycle response regulator